MRIQKIKFLFHQIMQKHNRASKHKPEYHLLNTSGLFNYPEFHLDWVRVGIGLYGFANHPKWTKTEPNRTAQDKNYPNS